MNNKLSDNEDVEFHTGSTPGLIPDPRPGVEKVKDWQDHELYSAIPLVWMPKDPSQWKSYSLRDQDGSSSCVGQGGAKALETLLKEIYSAHPIYRRRSNFPGEGMWLQDMANILKKNGTTTEVLDNSQFLDEEEMNRDVNVVTPVLIDGYAFVTPTDIDQIAQAIDLHKGVALTFRSTYKEWQDVPKIGTETNFWGHCVCATDYFMYQGEKALLIEDSWGKATSLGNGGQRIITETYLKARCSGAMYLIPHVEKPMDKPKYTFEHDLHFGMMASKEVSILQDCLKYLGYFPKDTDSTGNFFFATLSAVKKLQTEHFNEILKPAGLTTASGYCGTYTKKYINSIFS